MLSQVNVKKGKFTALDDSVGLSYAFEILIEELIGKSGNARMLLAAENQEEFDIWKETLEVCFNTAEKKLVRRTSSIHNPPLAPPAAPGEAPAAPAAVATAATAAKSAAPQPPTPPAPPGGAAAGRVARPPPVRPAIPTRTGSSSNMSGAAAAAAAGTPGPPKPPAMPGSAGRSLSPPPPARPQMPGTTAAAAPATAGVAPENASEPATAPPAPKSPTRPAMPGATARSVSPAPPVRPKTVETSVVAAAAASAAPVVTEATAPLPTVAPEAAAVPPRSVSPPPPARPNPVVVTAENAPSATDAPALVPPVSPVRPVMPSARSVSPPPPARPKSVEAPAAPTAAASSVVASEPPTAAPAAAPRSVSPPPPARAVSPAPPPAPRSVSPPPPPRAASPPPPVSATPSTPRKSEPSGGAVVEATTAPAAAPVAAVVAPVATVPAAAAVVAHVAAAAVPEKVAAPPTTSSPPEKTVTSTPSAASMGRTNSITIAPFSGSAAQVLHLDSEEEESTSVSNSPALTPSQTKSPSPAPTTPPVPPLSTPRTASKLFQEVDIPEKFRGSPDSVGSDYSDEVSEFDVHTSPMAPGRLPSSGNVLSMAKPTATSATTAPPAAAAAAATPATPGTASTGNNISVDVDDEDDLGISGPGSFASPIGVRKTESQSVPPFEQNSPLPTAPFNSQPNTPNTALQKIAAAQNKFKTPKFKNLLNSNGASPEASEKDKEKVTPTSASGPPKKLSAADLNRLKEEEEALLPPIIHKKIRTTRRRRELTINVRPTENIRMGYLAKLDSTSKHLDEEAWMSQFVSFNIQTGIFTHFAEINGRRIPRGKYDVNAIDVYTIEQVYHGKLFTFKLTRSVTDETTGQATDELLAAFAAEDLQQLNYWLISFEDCATEAERQAEVKRINSEKALAKKNSASQLTVDVNAPPEKPAEVVSPSKPETPSIKPMNSVRDTIKALARAPSFHFPKAESPVPSPPLKEKEKEEPEKPEPVKVPSAIEAALLAKKSILKRPSLSSTSRDSGDDVSPPKTSPAPPAGNNFAAAAAAAAAAMAARMGATALAAAPAAAAVTSPRDSALPPLPPKAATAAAAAAPVAQEPLSALLHRPSAVQQRGELHFNSAPATPLGTADHKQFVEDLPNTFNSLLNKSTSANQSMFGEPVKVVDLDDLDRSLGLDNMSSLVSPMAAQSNGAQSNQRAPVTRVPSMKLSAGSSVAALQLATSQAAAAAAANSNNVISAPIVPLPKALHSDVLGMRFKVDQVKYPAARLARRIKIWYCSAGFSLATEAEVRQFVVELKNTGDETLKSFADEKFDNILDWANLLEVLRKYELKLRLESPQSEIEDQAVVCRVGVSVPSRGDRVTFLDLSEEMTVAVFAEKLAKEFNLPLEDLLVHLPVLFSKTANPHQQSLNLLKDDLTFAEDLILYQEEVIDHLWDSYSVIKNLVEQRDDVINQLYTQISELKETNKLTLRDTIFNGGLNNDSPTTNTSSGIRGQKLQYSETPRKSAIIDPADEEGDVVISKEEWRKWTEEKHKLILQHNETKASLVNEIRLLRKTLNPSTEQTYLEMKRSESSRAMLEEELVKAQIQNDALKTEVAVMKQKLYESDIEKGMMESDWMERLNALAAKYEERLVQQYAEHQQELAQRSYFASEMSYLQPELQNDLTNNNFYMSAAAASASSAGAAVIDQDAVQNGLGVGGGGYSFNMALGAEHLDPEYSQFQQQQQLLNGSGGFNGNLSGQSFTDPESHTLESLLQSTSFAASSVNLTSRTPPSARSPNSRSNSITSTSQQQQQQDKSQWIQQYAQNHHALLGSPSQYEDSLPSRYRSYSQQQQQQQAGLLAPPELDQDLMDLSMYRSEYFADGTNGQQPQVSPSRRASADAAATAPTQGIRPRTSSSDLRGAAGAVDNVRTLPQSSSVASANNRLSRANNSSSAAAAASGAAAATSSKIIRQDPQTYDLTQVDTYQTTAVNRTAGLLNSEHPLRQALRNDTLNRLGGNNKAMPKPTRPQFPFQPRNDAAKRLREEQQRQQEALRAQPGMLPPPAGRAVSPSRQKVPQSPSRFMTNTENYKNKFNSEKEYVNPHIVDRHSGGWKFS